MSDSFISNPSACHDSLYPRSSLSSRVASRVAPPPSSARPSVLETANEIFPPSRHYNDRPSFPPRDWSQHVACARGSLRHSSIPRGGFKPRFTPHTGPPHKADTRLRGSYPCRGFYRPT